MTAVPATPVRVTIPSDVTVAITDPDVSVENRNIPLLSLVGAVSVNDISVIFFSSMVNAPKVGAIGETTNAPEMSLDVKFPHASCVTVRTVDPAPTMVTKPFDETVAALRLLLLY
jgi:hypothetical protein